MTEEGFPTYRLLHPELMSSDELITILGKYNLKVPLKKEVTELVEIYRRVVLPLPQRTYGSTWRERLLAKKQNRRKISLSEESSSFTIKRDSSTSSARSVPSRPVLDRLKPPLDSSVGKEKKIIKLSSSSTSKSEGTPVQNAASESTETKEVGKDKTGPSTKRKRITIDFSDSSEKSTPLPKVVSSKRSSEEKSPSQPVSKHRRIVI